MVGGHPMKIILKLQIVASAFALCFALSCKSGEESTPKKAPSPALDASTSPSESTSPDAAASASPSKIPGLADLPHQDALEACHQAGKVYDRRGAGSCHAATYVADCSKDWAVAEFKKDGVSESDSTQHIDDLLSKGYLVDQCGMLGSTPYLFLVNPQLLIERGLEYPSDASPTPTTSASADASIKIIHPN